MKLEKTYSKISIFETVLLTIFIFIVLNGVFFIIYLLTGNSKFLFNEILWIKQFLYSFSFSILLNATNRSGVIRITDFNDLETLANKIDELIQKKGLLRTDKDSHFVNYKKMKSLWKFFNLFFRQDVVVKYSEKEILIYGKRNIFLYIEPHLRYNRTL